MRYLRVKTLPELHEALQIPGSQILAGGTDLIVKMRAGLASPQVLVDVSDVDDLQGVHETAGSIEIGASTPEEDLLVHPLLRERLPLLAMVLRVLGSAQIRSRGTLAGNLVNASPAADSAIPLLLYDAEVVLEEAAGSRVLPVADFLLGPGKTALAAGEYIRSLRLPLLQDTFTPFFHKVGKRRALTIAIASVGALVDVAGSKVREARLAAGSVAPVPLRLHKAERLLADQTLTENLINQAAQAARDAVSPISDVRASADYRRDVIGDLVARALRSATA